MSEENYEWQFRLVYKVDGVWNIAPQTATRLQVMPVLVHEHLESALIQRRRRRDHLDPAPCEGIEDPIWRDWIASDDPDIQGVLIAKGMPFRSLEK